MSSSNATAILVSLDRAEDNSDPIAVRLHLLGLFDMARPVFMRVSMPFDFVSIAAGEQLLFRPPSFMLRPDEGDIISVLCDVFGRTTEEAVRLLQENDGNLDAAIDAIARENEVAEQQKFDSVCEQLEKNATKKGKKLKDKGVGEKRATLEAGDKVHTTERSEPSVSAEPPVAKKQCSRSKPLCCAICYQDMVSGGTTAPCAFNGCGCVLCVQCARRIVGEEQPCPFCRASAESYLKLHFPL